MGQSQCPCRIKYRFNSRVESDIRQLCARRNYEVATFNLSKYSTLHQARTHTRARTRTHTHTHIVMAKLVSDAVCEISLRSSVNVAASIAVFVLIYSIESITICSLAKTQHRDVLNGKGITETSRYDIGITRHNTGWCFIYTCPI